MRVLLSVFTDIRSTPLRTLAAILGMVAAVVSVIIVDSATVLSRRANDEYTERTFGRAVTARVSPTTGAEVAPAEALLANNGVRLVSRSTPLVGEVRGGQGVIPGSVAVVNATYNQIFVVDMVAGAWPRDTATAEVAHAVVSADFLAALRLQPGDVIGRQISFAPLVVDAGPPTPFDRGIPFVIDGVASTETNAFSAATASVLWVVGGRGDAFAGGLGSESLYLRVNPDDFALVQQLLAQLATEDGEPLFDVGLVDLATDIGPILDQQNVTARAVTWIALIIGGLGVLSVGLANVRERAFELGVRCALGATRLRPFSMVLVHTVVEVLLAAMIGIALAAALLDRFERRLVLSSLPLPVSTDLPVSSALRGVVGALIVGLLAGAIPALRAARVSVIRALRG